MRALPRANASPAFTREVLRKAHRPASRRSLPWRIAAGFAMAACLIAALQLGIAAQQRRHAEALALRAEQQRLEAELQAVKKIAHDQEPVVVLENDRARVIMDLESAAQNAPSRNYD